MGRLYESIFNPLRWFWGDIFTFFTPSFTGKGISPVDKDIRRLVSAMNVHGFRTYASCQGHGFPVDRIKPYVAFTSSQAEAARLARVLREDAESSAPKLRWGWEVTANFNSVFRLCFRLHPTGPHHGGLRYCRRSLRKDFGTIGQMLKSPGGEPGNGVDGSGGRL